MTADQQSRLDQIKRSRDALILAIGSDPNDPEAWTAIEEIKRACARYVKPIHEYPHDPAES